MTILPQDFARRSFLYRELESAGATFDEVNGAAIAMACGDDAAAEAAQARSLGLSDLSVLPRTGYKGWNMATWLQGQGAEMAEQNNNVSPQADGTRIARLAPGEALLLGDDQGQQLAGVGRLKDARGHTPVQGVKIDLGKKSSSFCIGFILCRGILIEVIFR